MTDRLAPGLPQTTTMSKYLVKRFDYDDGGYQQVGDYPDKDRAVHAARETAKHHGITTIVVRIDREVVEQIDPKELDNE